MSVAFEAAWMLLKQRGHELNLPKPEKQNVGPFAATMSPQDLTDARVKANSNMMGRINEFKDIDEGGTHHLHGGNNAMENAYARLMDRQAENEEMERMLSLAQDHQGEEAYFQGEQGALDRATLARRAQQPEADEMEAMGVPEMGRTMGGTPPANIGRAGSTDEMPMGEPPNPFPKPLEGRVQDQLAEFADGAGRRAAMSPTPDYSDAKEDDDMDASLAPFVGETPKGLGDNHPEAHNIASTNLRQTPRKQKRGMMDSGQAFKRPGFRGPAMPLPGGKKDGDFQNMPPQFY